MKKILAICILLFVFIISSCGSNTVLVNGIKSDNTKLNEIYEKSSEEEKNKDFIILIYEKDSVYSNYFIVDDYSKLEGEEELELDTCILLNYKSDSIIVNDGFTSEEKLKSGDVLILYTVNNESLTTYPLKLVVESLYKLDYNVSVKVNYDRYLNK